MLQPKQPTDFPQPQIVDNPHEDAELAISLIQSVIDLHPDVTWGQRNALTDAIRVLERLADV